MNSPDHVALYDGYGYPKADIASNVAGSYSSASGPTSYSTNSIYSVGFGGQFGYYVENNTKLASADPRGGIDRRDPVKGKVGTIERPLSHGISSPTG